MDVKELLTVKEFSNFSGIEQTTLRYWDEIGLFTPAHRNAENGYRYYSPVQIITVNFIKVMSSLNIPLKTISNIENTRTPESILALLEHQGKRLDMEMRRLRECYSTIHTVADFIKHGLSVTDIDEISVRELDEMPFILGPPNDFEGSDTFYGAFLLFFDAMRKNRVNPNFPMGGYYDDANRFFTNPGRPSHWYSTDPTAFDIRPAGEYLTAYTRGYYGEVSDTPDRIAAYMKEHGLEFDGPLFEHYLLDEICVSDPSQYLACVSVAVKKARYK